MLQMLTNTLHFSVVYMELGLTLPLYRFDGKTVSVPRSGGELNYVRISLNLLDQLFADVNASKAQIYVSKTIILCYMYLWNLVHPPRQCGHEFDGFWHECPRRSWQVRVRFRKL